MKYLATCLFVLTAIATPMEAQRTHLYFGAVKASNQDVSITSPGTHHYGYKAGVNRRIIGRGIYLLGGLQYTRISSQGTPDPVYFHPERPLHIGQAGLSIGLTPLALTRFLKWRLRIGGAYNYMLGGHRQADLPELQRGYKSVDLSTGITIGVFTFDLGHERSMDNLSAAGSSKFRFWYLTGGLEF